MADIFGEVEKQFRFFVVVVVSSRCTYNDGKKYSILEYLLWSGMGYVEAFFIMHASTNVERV